VKNAVAYIGKYEEAVAQAALDRKMDGIVCGHIHSAEIREMNGVTYYNDGDWVESCTALVEDFKGAMSLVDWTVETRLHAERIAAERAAELAADAAREVEIA